MHDAGYARTPRPFPRLLRIRTDDWPARDRVSMFREAYGQDGVVVEPRRGEPLRIDAVLLKLPDLGVLQGRRSPLRSEFRDGSDRLLLNLGGPAAAVQSGRELHLDRGDAVALSGAEISSVTTSRGGRVLTFEFPRGGLLPKLKQPDRGCARRIPSRSLSLRLLRGYARAIFAHEQMEATCLPELAIAHIHDLAALAVGAGREAEEIAKGRGLRAARLRAIRRDVLARIEHDVSLGELAARHGLSPRYVGMLFESEGTSLTEFVREERLRRARSLLLGPRGAGRRIAEIAYAVGFNDLSYFNRSFRRRFGQSPSEVREQGQSEG